VQDGVVRSLYPSVDVQHSALHRQSEVGVAGGDLELSQHLDAIGQFE